MQTDLSKILAVTGRHGLFEYVAQARGGVIAQALADGKRTLFDVRSRITSLADISIYTDGGELKLKEVLLMMKEILGDGEAPSSKAPADELKAFFDKAVPEYDGSRFYVSHMKKVVEWYNEILRYASFDFVDPEQETPADE